VRPAEAPIGAVLSHGGGTAGRTGQPLAGKGTGWMEIVGSSGPRSAGVPTSRRRPQSMKRRAPSLPVRRPSNTEHELALARLRERWGGVVVTRAVVHALAELPMLVARRGDLLVGCLTFRQEKRSVEVITLDAFVERTGVGSALLHAAIRLAPRVWHVTTNDKLPAQACIASMRAADRDPSRGRRAIAVLEARHPFAWAQRGGDRG
jgi:GNAT superfamily N-acetyltransferase